MKKYDIIVIGGSVVGSSISAALLKMGLNVALVEQRPFSPDWPPIDFDLRNYAINRASIHLFNRLGVWQAMEKMRIEAFRAMEVWDASGSGRICFNSREIGEDCLGYIIEHQVILTALYSQLTKHKAFSYYSPAKIDGFTIDENQVALRLQDGQTLYGQLLLGTDGRDSAIRQQAGIGVDTWPQKHHALVANIELEYSHQETAWQRFLPTGPLAFLPLSDRLCSIVWSTTPQLAKELLSMSEQTFIEHLENAIDHRFGNLKLRGKRASFALLPQHANNYVQHRLCLLGDAAHAIHPLAGQGLNLGLLDVATLWEVLETAKQRGKDIGKMATLRVYERWRKGHNYLTLQIMQAFTHLFGHDHPVVKTVRNLGLNITNSLGPIKDQITRYACGLRGDLPNKARNPDEMQDFTQIQPN